MSYIIGSARHDENGKYSGGKAGDQTGHEVETQEFYVHTYGWNVLRLKNTSLAEQLGNAMIIACGNNNIGYSQDRRTDIFKEGIFASKSTSCDCSTLVKQCVNTIGIKCDIFTTANEVSKLQATGAFLPTFKYTYTKKLYKGDILVSCKKGHTAIVTSSPYTPYTKHAYIAKPTLKASKSVKAEVKILQDNLNKFGDQKLVVDGIYGSKTTNAVKNVQSLFKISIDGIYGKNTYKCVCALAQWKGYEVS